MEPEKNSLSWEERLERLKAQREMERVTPMVPVAAKVAPLPIPKEVPVKTVPIQIPIPKEVPVKTRPLIPTAPVTLVPVIPTVPIIPTVVPTNITPISTTPRVASGPVGVSLNTHDYDGKLVEQVTGSMAPIMKNDFYDSMGKFRRIMELYQTLEQGSGNWAHYFDLIVADHQRAPPNNFDPSNGVDAAQVLYNIHLKIQTLLSLTQLQLEDMASGPCPQGRATRLLSVFLST
jgi:hypothetical protein